MYCVCLRSSEEKVARADAVRIRTLISIGVIAINLICRIWQSSLSGADRRGGPRDPDPPVGQNLLRKLYKNR